MNSEFGGLGLGALPPFLGLGTPLSAASSAPRQQWIAVQERFEQFDRNVALTDAQRADGIAKARGVLGSLNQHYYGSPTGATGLLVGSWGKRVATRPPRDVDLYCPLPWSAYARFERYAWNKQSALLQEVKVVLARSYPNTDMRGDGQVVVVSFGSYAVEIAPVFELSNGQFFICDTHDGGSYKQTDPRAELAHIEAVDAATNRNLRPMIGMLKAWQRWCSVPLASFELDLLVAAFLQQSPWRLESCFYYDWLMRDFFAWLYGQANKVIYMPGTLQPVYLGDAWQSRTLTAFRHAKEACECEQGSYVHVAGEEWQKIFGPDIPSSV